MAKNYFVQFTTVGNPTLMTGLTPTFIVFKTVPDGNNVSSPPGITEIPSGTGLYYFTYATGQTSVAFVIDGGSSLSSSSRYVSNILDPIQAVDEQLAAQGTTLTAMGTSLAAMGDTLLTFGSSLGFGDSIMALLGSTASSFGNTATDPATVFGYLKRLQEFNEGDSVFTKSTGLWDIYSRGASVLLIEKGLVDSTTDVVKT